MASSIIHIAVASEINKKLKRNESKLFIGTIAPDISKQIGETKEKSHFLDLNEENIPNIYKFLNKYKNNLNDDFVLGYYIHLLTDYFWFKHFIPELSHDNMITRLDGTSISFDDETFLKYIYNDYTNLNIKLIDEYNLNLKIFYNDVPSIENIIEEIPMEKLNIIINKAGEIIKNSKENKAYLFNISNIKIFISTTVDLIIAALKDVKVID